MIVQILSSKSRWVQFTMGNLILVIFIVYYLDLIFPINKIAVYVSMALLGAMVVFMFKKLMQLRRQVKPFAIWKANKYKHTKINIGAILLESTLSGGLVAIHFWMFWSAGKEIMPLVWDYGFAGVAFLGIRFFMDRNYFIGIAEEGVLVGSKFEPKLVSFSEISSALVKEKFIELSFNKGYPLSKVVLQPEQQLLQVRQLLEMKGVEVV